MTAPPDNSGYIPRQQPTLSGKTLHGSAPAPRFLGTDKDRTKAALEKYFPDDAIVQGLMANAFHESKFDSEVFETPKQSDEEKAQNSPGTFRGGQKQGYGLFQFTGKQLTDYVDWLETKGIEDSMDAQVKFVHDNIYTGKYEDDIYTGPHDIGGKARKKLLKDFYSGDPEKIAKSFATNYEKMKPAGQPAVRGTTAKKYAEEADPVFPSNQLLDYQFGQFSPEPEAAYQQPQPNLGFAQRSGGTYSDDERQRMVALSQQLQNNYTA